MHSGECPHTCDVYNKASVKSAILYNIYARIVLYLQLHIFQYTYVSAGYYKPLLFDDLGIA